MRKYDESRVLRSLGNNYGACLTYEFGFKCLEFPLSAKGEIGIHSLGMIDFLVNYCGYRPPIYVDRKTPVRRKKNADTEDVSTPIKKNKVKTKKMQ